MKLSHPLRTFICAALSLLSQGAFGETWQTVDDYQYSPGDNARVRGLVLDPSGNCFAAGNAKDARGAWHAVAMRSSDHGNSWATVDDFSDNGAAPDEGPGYDGGIVADSLGNLYAAGYDQLPNRTQYWFVRRSLNAGLTWSTVDTFNLGGSTSIAEAVSADLGGNVYVLGSASTASNSFTVMRRGTPGPSGTMVWSTVSQVAASSFSIANPPESPLLCHPTAGIFLGGHNTIKTKSGANVTGWIIRRSIDGGQTWLTVDAYQLDSTQAAYCYGVGADRMGAIYAVGTATQISKGRSIHHWIVRRSRGWESFIIFVGISII